ncbi:MAG: SO_0444 family Cu/Zn efflux transporter [Planctomycetota bacterium]|jgi:uncharacterized membrane protein YraQ (UPF0718 family)
MPENVILRYLKEVALDFWGTVAAMSPYLLFGFFVAGILSVLVSQRFVERHLGGAGLWPLMKASLFGVPLPLCSCGVLPVSMSLHKHGASKGSTVSFLLSTPQTGVDSIFVTLSLLGPVFAVFRPLVAFATGLIGGAFVDLFDKDPKDDSQTPPKCTDECCDGEQKSSRLTRGLKYGFVTLPGDIGKAMLVGLVVAAVISALVPDDFFAERLLGTGVLAMVVMMILGIPVYVCATASVPVAAVLIAKGLSPGAALVFLITGPATNAAAFTTIWKVLGHRTAMAYVLTVVVCALGSGLLLDALFPGLGGSVQTQMHQMGHSIVGHVTAIVLLAVLAFAILSERQKAH